MSKITDKKSFVLYSDLRQTLIDFSIEDKGHFFNAILDFQNKIPINLPPHLTPAFAFLKTQFVRDSESYLGVLEKRRLAGMKSGIIRRRNSRTKRTSVHFVEQNEHLGTKRTDSVSDTDNVNDLIPTSTSTPNKTSTPRALNANAPTPEALFEIFWKKYVPVKTTDGKFTDKGAKKTALQAFLRALAKGIAYDTITIGTARYFAHCRANNQPTCHVSTFLNQERFFNEYDEIQNAEKSGKKTTTDEWAELVEKAQENLANKNQIKMELN